MKTAFIHLMKSAGSTVNAHLCSKVLWRAYFRIENSWESRESDWTRDELEEFADTKEDKIYVHSHGAAWQDDILQRYIHNDWFTFCFYRHPGDQWCSFYYWCRDVMGSSFPSVAHDYELDEFLRLAWSPSIEDAELNAAFQNLRDNLDLPNRWRELSYVAIFSPEVFKKFLKKYFRSRSWHLRANNTSPNRGYEFYRSQGLISDETHKLLIHSNRMDDYQELLAKPHDIGNKFTRPEHNVLYQRRFFKRIEPVRYIILFQGRAGSTLLTENLANHPWIHAFEEVLDTFPQTWSNQRRWLKKFYVRLPIKDRSIRVIGFKAKYTSISNHEGFKDFIEKHQIKVIHLHRSNPVKLAISVIRAELLRKKTGRSNLYDEKDSLGKVKIPVEYFEHGLKRIKNYKALEEYVDTINTPKLSLTYEEFLSDLEGSMNRVYDFLPVRRTGLTNIEVKKNTPDNLYDAVENLDELREAFPELESFFCQ